MRKMNWRGQPIERWSRSMTSEEVEKTPFPVLEGLSRARFPVSILVENVHTPDLTGMLMEIIPGKGKGVRTKVTIQSPGGIKTIKMNTTTRLSIAYLKKG